MAKMMIPRSEARRTKIFTGFSIVFLAPYLALFVQANSSPTCREPSVQISSQQTNFIIAGECNENTSLWLSQYRPTFEVYLNSTAGALFSPPIRFTLVALNTTAIIRLALIGDVDFVFLTPSTYACIDAAVGLSPIAASSHNVTIAGRSYFLTATGGAAVARADDLALRTLADLRGRVVEGPSGDGLLPFWRLFADAGLSLLQDPAQVSMSVRVRASVRLRVCRRT